MGEIPWVSVSISQLPSLVIQNIRPDQPDEEDCPDMTDEIWSIITQCWANNPKERPGADAVGHMIADLCQNDSFDPPTLLAPIPRQSHNREGSSATSIPNSIPKSYTSGSFTQNSIGESLFTQYSQPSTPATSVAPTSPKPTSILHLDETPVRLDFKACSATYSLEYLLASPISIYHAPASASGSSVAPTSPKSPSAQYAEKIPVGV